MLLYVLFKAGVDRMRFRPSKFLTIALIWEGREDEKMKSGQLIKRKIKRGIWGREERQECRYDTVLWSGYEEGGWVVDLLPYLYLFLWSNYEYSKSEGDTVAQSNLAGALLLFDKGFDDNHTHHTITRIEIDRDQTTNV